MTKLSRDLELDTAKGFLMLCVIFGHCFLQDFSDEINLTLVNYIYLFHMPMFIIISGYFSKISDTSKFWKGIISLVSLYTFWHLVKVGLLGWWSLKSILFCPTPMMWYIHVLIVWRILHFACNKYFTNPPFETQKSSLIAVMGGVILGLLIGYFDFAGDYLALSRMFVFAPFFLIGTALQKVEINKLKQCMPTWLSATILVTCFICVLLINTDMSYILQGNKSYEYTGACGILYRVTFYIVASLISLCILNLIKPSAILIRIGNDSLKYYIYHGVALIILQRVVPDRSFMYAFTYAALLCASLYVFNRWKISDILINPILKIRDLLK